MNKDLLSKKYALEKHVPKRQRLIFGLLILLTIYGFYLMLYLEGTYSPFINGAKEQYYKNCERYDTCSEDVARTLSVSGTLKIKGIEPITFGWYQLIYHNVRANTGGVDYIDAVKIRYIAKQSIAKQKILAEKFVRNEPIIELTNTKLTNIPVIGGKEEDEKQIKRILEYIDHNKPYGYQYLENVNKIEIAYDMDPCGYASMPDNKIKINFNENDCMHGCNVWCNNDEAQVSLIINEACKVSLMKEIYGKNDYDNYKTCIEVETFCADEAKTLKFDGRDPDTFLGDACKGF